MPDTDQPLIELHDVSFSYRAMPVLRGLDWQWRRGQQWACIGPNGAGKTTLAKLLSHQLDTNSGSIRRSPGTGGTAYVCFEQQQAMCNRDRQLDDSEFRSDASDPGTTVRQAIGAAVTDAELRPWTERLSITHILDRGIRFVSTGEMRKTLLLRAILQHPDLLILDSPLDGLDRHSQADMHNILQELLGGDLRLMLLCRSLGDIPKGITHLLVMDRGRALASGEREQVLEDPKVQALMRPPPLPLGRVPEPSARSYALDPVAPLLQLRNVSVSYGEVCVLHEANWTFSRGQHCSISGPNGCGKTTLLSLVNGDNHKAYGQDITLFGLRRGSGESVWDIKQKFGLLNTQIHLNHARGMRVIEVVVSGFFDTIGLYDDWGDKQRQIATEWLRALGLEDLARAPFDTLSFGLQRMVLLARAMVKSPAILLLDEPCLGLDEHNTGTILRALDHIAAHSDTQLLFVSHSAGDIPVCINQWLEFIPANGRFELVCREQP